MDLGDALEASLPRRRRHRLTMMRSTELDNRAVKVVEVVVEIEDYSPEWRVQYLRPSILTGLLTVDRHPLIDIHILWRRHNRLETPLDKCCLDKRLTKVQRTLLLRLLLRLCRLLKVVSLSMNARIHARSSSHAHVAVMIECRIAGCCG